MTSELSANELLQRIVQADEEAWEEFLRRFHPVIAASAARVMRQHGLTEPALIDEIVQEVYLKLCDRNCKLLREFQGEREHCLYSFLKVVSANAARDHSRALLAAKRGGGGTVPLSDESVRDQGEFPNLLEHRLFMEKVEAALANCTEKAKAVRDRTVFWLYYRQGFTAREIAGLPGFELSDKGVQSLLGRLVHCIRLKLVEGGEKLNAASAASNPF